MAHPQSGTLSATAPTSPQTRQGLLWLIVVSTSLLLLTWLFAFFDLDLKIQRLFYDEDLRWPRWEAQPWHFLYRYGTIPGVLFIIAVLIGLFRSFRVGGDHQLRRAYGVIALTAILGVGVLINTVLKPYWGRPRPDQTIEFKGPLPYRGPLSPGIPGKGRSFPSGHSSMGFIFVTLLALRRRSALIGYGGLAFGLLYGSLLGVGRTVQGGHFITDSIWALGLIALVGIGMHYWGYAWAESLSLRYRRLSRKGKMRLFLALMILTPIVGVGFLTHCSYYNMSWTHLPLTDDIRELVVTSDIGYESVDIDYRDDTRPALRVFSSGFGWTRATDQIHFEHRIDGNRLLLFNRSQRKGYFAKLTHTIEIVLPTAWEDTHPVQFHTLPTTAREK